jgi:hypothetical protein
MRHVKLLDPSSCGDSPVVTSKSVLSSGVTAVADGYVASDSPDQIKVGRTPPRPLLNPQNAKKMVKTRQLVLDYVKYR